MVQSTFSELPSIKRCVSLILAITVINAMLQKNERADSNSKFQIRSTFSFWDCAWLQNVSNLFTKKQLPKIWHRDISSKATFTKDILSAVLLILSS